MFQLNVVADCSDIGRLDLGLRTDDNDDDDYDRNQHNSPDDRNGYSFDGHLLFVGTKC